jgi:alpha-L-fucosidase
MTSRPLLLLACLAGLVQAQEIAAPEAPEGFETLFAGQDLYGWIGLAETAALQGEANRLAGQHWGAKSGELVADGHAVALRTERSYRCFELLLDWKAAEEVALTIELRGGTSIVLGGETGAAGSVAGVPPLVLAAATAGEWNRARVRVTPAHLSVWVNGAPTAWHRELAGTAEGTRPAFAAAIALVVEGGEARFRDLFLKILPEEALPGEDPAARAERAAWWSNARLGLAIDWGLYSIPAGVWEGEALPGPLAEIMDAAHIPPAEYARLASRLEGGGFDAARWVDAARSAGAGYLVVASKLRDGFAMFDSAHTDHDVMASPFGRDVMREVADAAHDAGLRLGWSYSIADWHDPDYLPRRSWETRSAEGARPDRYRAVLEGQISELLSNYGDVDGLWFDGGEEQTWTRAMGHALFAHARVLRPDLLINDRLDKGRLDPALPRDTEFLGDFATPQGMAALPARGEGLWELRIDLDQPAGAALSARELIRALCETAGVGGNLLISVAPGPAGDLPAKVLERLAALGRWLEVNGASVRGTTLGPFLAPAWGACTRKGDRLYLHLFDWPEEGTLVLGGLENAIDKAWMLSDPEETFLPMQRVDGSPVIELPDAAPDSDVSVIVLDIDGEPDVRSR